MKVLIITAVFPYPLFSGGQIRIYNLLRNLSLRHSISLASFIRSDRELAYLGKLNFLDDIHTVKRGKAMQFKYLFKTLFGRYPLLLSSYDSSQMKLLVRKMLSQKHYDLIHIEPFYVFPSLPENDLPLVVSEHNIEHEVYGDYANNSKNTVWKKILSWDTGKIRKWEDLVCKKANQVITVSQKDQEKLIQRINKQNISVVSNGVDISYFRFCPRHKRKFTKKILFVGNFAWVPNLNSLEYLLDSIWPEIQEEMSDCSLNVVGQNLPAAFKYRIKDKNIHYLHNVTDIRKQYHECDLLLAPIKIAGGTKFKLLEAMASGLPVVTTRQGAAGLPVRDNFHLKISDTPSSFAEAIRSVYQRKPIWDKICSNARLLVEQKYSWENISKVQEKVWQKAMS